MESSEGDKKKITVFVLLTFAISSIFYYFMYSTGKVLYGPLWMWSPGAAAVLTQLLFRDSIKNFGWRLGERRYLLWGWGIPLLYGLAIYGTTWITGLGGFQVKTITVSGTRLPFIVSLLVQETLLLIPACFAALGEEMGWRGFLIPELVKVTSFTKAALITGIIWVVWHYPAIIYADYRSDSPLLFQLLTFSISVLGMSFYTAWLRLKSRSIWSTVLWHGNHNALIQGLFLSMTTFRGLTKYIVDDFGIGLTIASMAFGYVFWLRRHEI
jgi:membrane protease YdiL (CAAX protease family)